MLRVLSDGTILSFDLIHGYYGPTRLGLLISIEIFF